MCVLEFVCVKLCIVLEPVCLLVLMDLNQTEDVRSDKNRKLLVQGFDQIKAFRSVLWSKLLFINDPAYPEQVALALRGLHPSLLQVL